jgi:uncharacterized protein
MRSCIYSGQLLHRRFVPVQHAFRYRLAMFWLDLDELAELDRRVRGFSVNRPNLVSFDDRDHFDGAASPTKTKVLNVLRHHGIDLGGGKIFVLTQCRVFGYVFNPVSFYYCHGDDDRLRCVVAEVNNTFGQRHVYLLGAENQLAARSAAGRNRYRAVKAMHVSPFASMDATYEFDLAPMAERLSVRIQAFEHGVRFFGAQLCGRRVELTSRAIASLVLRDPLRTVKVIGAIHWQALRLYLKGAPFYHQPPASHEQVARPRPWQPGTEEGAP